MLFLTLSEQREGKDLNGDGDTEDAVLHMVDLGELFINPDLADPVFSPGLCTLKIQGLDGRGHVVEFKNSLADEAWRELPTQETGTEGTITVTDPDAVAPMRFYRVRIE